MKAQAMTAAPALDRDAGRWDHATLVKRLELLNANFRVGMVTNFLGAVLLGYVLYGWDWTPTFQRWAMLIALTLLLTSAALWKLKAMTPAQGQVLPTHLAYVALHLALGAAWGLGMLLFFEPGPERIAILVVAVMASQVAALSGTILHPPSAYAFNLAIVLPLMWRLATTPSSYTPAMVAAMLMVTVVVIFFVHRAHRVISTSIHMRFENDALNEALTEQRVQERTRIIEAASKHKSQFLANMSHELRTPLNAIIGFSDVLAEQMFGQVNDKQLEYLRDIHSSGEHLLMLINDVLDISKVEAGRMALELSTVDLEMLLQDSLTLVRERALRQGLSLTLAADEGLAPWVADARKLKQVMLNLLSNAVKFTPAGGSVAVRATQALAAAGTGVSAPTSQVAAPWVHISVHDSGVGIAPAEQGLVFEEFRQAGGDHLRKAEGTGLGLSLAKRFVELHGGTIRLDSQPGKGSTFTVSLPLLQLEVMP